MSKFDALSQDDRELVALQARISDADERADFINQSELHNQIKARLSRPERERLADHQERHSGQDLGQLRGLGKARLTASLKQSEERLKGLEGPQAGPDR